jgi:hypothetical protein
LPRSFRSSWLRSGASSTTTRLSATWPLVSPPPDAPSGSSCSSPDSPRDSGGRFPRRLTGPLTSSLPRNCERGGLRRGVLIQDCEVCCNPWGVRVSGRGEEREVSVAPAD